MAKKSEIERLWRKKKLKNKIILQLLQKKDKTK